jgi:hypothetical protein
LLTHSLLVSCHSGSIYIYIVISWLPGLPLSSVKKMIHFVIGLLSN